jgi:endoglucanase
LFKTLTLAAGVIKLLNITIRTINKGSILIAQTNITHKFNQKLFIVIALTLLLTLTLSLAAIRSTSADSSPIVSNWWPVNNASITGTQPFKAILSNWNINDYHIYWSVDNGQPNEMPTNYTDVPHKEMLVTVNSWNWRTDNTYLITYIAKNNSGTELARTQFNVVIPPSAATSSTVVSTNSKGALQNMPLYVDLNSSAKQQADAWRLSRPADASQIDKIAAQAGAKWFGGWNNDLYKDVNSYVGSATAQSQLPVLVAYNIPQRDCGGYSAGGSTSDGYITWIKSMAAAIGSRPAVVILEPDSVANLDCLSATDQATRLSLLSQAVSLLKNNPNTHVYLDGGHPQWKPLDSMSARLKQANIAAADGFSLNVSNYYTTAANTVFGKALSNALGGKHFVIDTSRNGNGPTIDNQWCNPADRALGERPTTQVSDSLIDAYLWVKAPGESDGACNGGPTPGTWWGDYALGLAQRAAY